MPPALSVANTRPADPGPGERGRARDASHAARSGAVQILTALSQSLGLVTHVAAARLFGPLAFGTYQACVAIVEMLSRGGTGGADKAMLRYVAGFRAQGDEASVDRAIGTGLRLCWKIGVTLAVGALVAVNVGGDALFGPGVAATLPYLALAVPLAGTTLILVQSSLAVRVTRANLYVRGLAEPALLLACVLAASAVGGSARALGIAYSVAAAGTLGVAFAVVGRVFGHRRLLQASRASTLPGFRAFSLPIGAADVLNSILQRADIVIVTAYLGPQSAAFYVAAEFLARVIANVRYAFDSIAASVLSEALHLGDRPRLRYNLALMTRWVITVTLPLAMTMIALRHDLLALYGPEFGGAASALVILAIGQLLSGCLGLTPWILLVSGRSRVLLFANLGGAILNISLSLVLIPRLGLVGAALAVLATITGFQIILNGAAWAAERVHPFELRQLKPLVAAGAAFFAQTLLPSALRGPTRIAATVLCIVVTYGALLLLLRLPHEERQALARLRAKLR